MRLLPLLVTLALCACPEAWAFTPRTRVLIVQRALTLMPDAVQTQMKRHARPLFRGALEGTEEIGEEGLSAFDPGRGDEELEQAVGRAVAALDRQAPMAEVAAEMGAIARRAADLAFPLNVGPSDPREKSLYLAYARFVESRHERIVVTFGGFRQPELARDDLRGFAMSLADEARRDYAGILRSYFPEGRASVPGDFDDRSVAFATASLGVSRAVTATARAWLYAWHRAHGDLAGSPGIAGDHPFGAGAAPVTEREEPAEASDLQPQEERR